MNDQILMAELDKTLAEFRALQYSSIAKPQYGILQDVIFWEDELPPEAQFDAMNFITHIFRLRMESAKTHSHIKDSTWGYFKRLVPAWPGFRPERCDPSTLLTEYELRRTRGRGRNKT